jgi:spore germination protein YaaH
VAGGADGASVDFEGVSGTRKQALVTFLGDLRAALNSAVPGAYLSIATPAVDWSNAFDYDELAARCDHLMIMAYDYHWSTSATTGPVAPLAGWGSYNISWTIADYITWGAPRSKMLLGVPYYGYRWPSVSGAAGSTTTATGTALTYSNVMQEVAMQERLWDAPSATPWYREQTPSWRQAWYDDDTSLTAKYARVLSEDLAGIGIWALGYDGTRPELWAVLGNAFGAPTSSVGAVASLIAAPNPFRESVTFARASGRELGPVAIHDVRGRMGRLLPAGARTWDGRDFAGRDVAAGVYFAQLRRDGAAPPTHRLVRVR